MARCVADDWRVAETTVGAGACWVSTVFLGLDHNFGSGEPLLFETMAFLLDDDGAPHLGEPTRLRRYSSWADAELGHADLVRRLAAEHEGSHVITADVLARFAMEG